MPSDNLCGSVNAPTQLMRLLDRPAINDARPSGRPIGESFRTPPSGQQRATNDAQVASFLAGNANASFIGADRIERSSRSTASHKLQMIGSHLQSEMTSDTRIGLQVAQVLHGQGDGTEEIRHSTGLSEDVIRHHIPSARVRALSGARGYTFNDQQMDLLWRVSQARIHGSTNIAPSRDRYDQAGRLIFP